MSDDLDDYTCKADFQAVCADMRTECGLLRTEITEVRRQMVSAIRLLYVLIGMLGAIGIKMLFFTKWTI